MKIDWDDPEQRRLYSREWYKEDKKSNPEKYVYKTSPEKRARYRQYYAEHKDKAAKYHADNRELINKKQRERRAKWPKERAEAAAENLLRGRLKRRYGITVAEYAKLYAAQNGVCAICSRPGRTGWRTPLGVDHCHYTGRVRGLLCVRCNTAIGTFGDTLEGIQRVVRYLSEPH